MATDTDRMATLQALADSTALIYDRAAVPEKIVGQAWLISKGRIVTLASNVSNYSEAPWALAVKFPHPDVHYAVRTVTLHPDFNKRDARDFYLAQAANPNNHLNLNNDIATLALDSDLTPPTPERLAELNRALSVPFEISNRDMSGAMRGGDLQQILQSTLSTGRSGLISMVDGRNIPFARIAIKQTRIIRARYHNLFNEVALCELLWRNPGGSFAFQPIEDFSWPADVPEMATPPEQVIAEAMRRAEELPRIVEMLGGPDTCFQKVTDVVNFNSINQSDRWLAERVWAALDSYLPLDKISEKAGGDTYSVMKMIWDLATMGLIVVNPNSNFHASGQLGPLLVPAQDLELNVWDPLMAFYLDPSSFAPTALSGNFFGGAHVLNTKTLVHTANVPQNSHGTAVFKDGKLIGIHTGPLPLQSSSPPPFALQRMMWIGALNDLGTKRLRTAEVNALEAAEGAADGMDIDPAVSQKLAGLRTRALMNEGDAPQAVVPEETGPLAKYSKQQIAGVSAAIAALGFVMMLLSMMAPHPGPTTATAPTTTTGTATDSAAPAPTPTPVPVATATGTPEEVAEQTKMAATADQIAGLKAPPPPTFKFYDSTELTAPRESFGVKSEVKNLDMLFGLWPNFAPQNDLNIVAKRLPFYNYYRMDDAHNEYSSFTPHFKYVSNHYWVKEGEKTMAVVGTLPAADPSKCIVFIAKPLNGDSIPDTGIPARLIDDWVVANEKLKGGKSAVKPATDPATTGGAAEMATPAQLADYRKKIGALIKSHYKSPRIDDENLDTRAALKVTVDTAGEIVDISLQPSPNEQFNDALQKALDACKPLPPAPLTKKGRYGVIIVADGGQISVEEQ